MQWTKKATRRSKSPSLLKVRTRTNTTGYTAILQALDSEAAHTSFGNLPLSVEKSEPQYSFPQAKQADGDKIFLGEDLAKTVNAGVHSPAPIYDGEDQPFKYQQEPAWGFGTAPRMSESKPRYDFYENERFLDDPIEADHTRQERCKAPKIGTEPRFPL